MREINILLVEDNEGDIILTTEALQEGKIANNLTVVTDGKEAVEYLEKEGQFESAITPDLILLDVNLPKMNGHEVLSYIKSSESLRMIPVVMLTTSSSEIDIVKSYKNFVNCYITKPIDANDFVDAVLGIQEFWISIVQLPPKLENK